MAATGLPRRFAHPYYSSAVRVAVVHAKGAKATAFGTHPLKALCFRLSNAPARLIRPYASIPRTRSATC
jgi:hypothetical protein